MPQQCQYTAPYKTYAEWACHRSLESPLPHRIFQTLANERMDREQNGRHALAFREVLQWLPVCDVLSQGLDVETLLVVNGAKSIRYREHFASHLLKDLCCPCSHIPKSLRDMQASRSDTQMSHI